MPKSDPAAALPAPLSLTLEDAGKVAGGAAYTVALHPWYWYGQPAYLNVVNQFNPVANVAIGQTAFH